MSAMIEWDDELWYSDSVITNEMKFNSFNYSLISSSLDASEDDQFREYEYIWKGNEIIQIENDDLNLYDDCVASRD